MADDTVFEWRGHEHRHRERGSDWFWMLGILAIALAIASIIFGNTLFALLIIISAFTLAMFAAKQPRLHAFRINKRGIAIDDTLYPYQSIVSFWVEDRDEEKEPRLIFNIDRGLLPFLVIPLGETDPDRVRDYLDDRIDEEELHEPLSQVALELIGF